MGATIEREVKLRPGSRFERLEIRGRELDERILQSDYFDTEDLRLAAASVTLRRRSGDNGSAVWQLKLPGSGPDRLEVEWPATGEAIPAQIEETLLAHTRGRRLVETAALRTRRSGVTITQSGRDVAEVVHDDVEVLGEDGVTRRFEELEIELIDGTAKDLRRLERQLRKAGAIDPDGRPKLMQALDFVPRRDPRGKARTSGDYVVRALRRQYEEILEAERAGLDELERPGATDIVELLKERREDAQATMQGDLSAPAYISALDRLEIALEDPKLTADGSLGRVVCKEHRRARRLVRRTDKNPSDSELHEIRKAVKRSRYAAELAADAGVSGARRYINRAKVVQDVLGDHHDAVVAAATLENLEPDLHRPIARMAAFSLRDRQRRRRAASRSDFAKSWRKLEAAARSFR